MQGQKKIEIILEQKERDKILNWITHISHIFYISTHVPYFRGNDDLDPYPILLIRVFFLPQFSHVPIIALL